MDRMIAFHLDPGPRGFAVIGKDNTILADHLTSTQALRLVRGEEPEPKLALPRGQGIAHGHWAWGEPSVGRVDSSDPGTYWQKQSRKAERAFASLQSSGETNWYSQSFT